MLSARSVAIVFFLLGLVLIIVGTQESGQTQTNLYISGGVFLALFMAVILTAKPPQ